MEKSELILGQSRLGVVLKTLGLAALALMAPLSPALAGTDTKDTKEMATPAPCVCSDKDWTLELGSGALFSNVRSTDNAGYTLIPVSLTASLALDEVSLDNFLGGFLRGYTEFYFRGDYDFIVHGPENYFADILAGPRYNFVQPGWAIVPYIEAGVGIGFTDSNPLGNGFGQDFNFTFDVGAGFKYNICDDFFLRLGVEYQHVSNGGLSEPQFANHPIDGLGPKLSFGYAF